MILLNSSIRLIVLQFRSSNTKFIPNCIPEREAEFRKKKQEYKRNGVVVVEPTKNCCLLNFAMDLEKSEYRLVDAFFQGRQNEDDRIFYITRFTFVGREHIETGSQEANLREWEEGFHAICNEALWKTQVFLNPFYDNGKEISGQNSVSINSVARRPLFDQKGERLKVWRKDSNGDKAGDEPVEIKPEHILEITNGAISVYP